MNNILTNILEHPKTTLEGLGWGAAMMAVGYYALSQMHCDLALVTGANFLPFLAGLIPVVRGALAQDHSTGGSHGTEPTPPAP
jgi:hypothetical protein